MASSQPTVIDIDSDSDRSPSPQAPATAKTTDTPIDIEAESTAPFLASEWIGAGKKYAGAPLRVYKECDRILLPPDFIAQSLPHPDMPISDFIAYEFPPIVIPPTFSPESWFSPLPPTVQFSETDCQRLTDVGYPGKNACKMLKEAFGQKWLDGANSISFPVEGASTDTRYPLWMVGYWASLKELRGNQGAWRKAERTACSWFPRDSEFHPSKTFSTRGWSSSIQMDNVEFSAQECSPLLSDAMINDNVVHAMVSHLNRRLAKSAASSAHYITASTFIGALRSYKAHPRKTPALVVGAEKALKRPGVKLWIPVLRELHHVVYCIDSLSETILLGDSLGAGDKVEAEALLLIQWWLKRLSDSIRKQNKKKKNSKKKVPNYAYAGNTLVRGMQNDTVSCIPISMNTICHGVFGDDLWTPSIKHEDRARWFMRLVPELPGGNSSGLPDCQMSANEEALSQLGLEVAPTEKGASAAFFPQFQVDVEQEVEVVSEPIISAVSPQVSLWDFDEDLDEEAPELTFDIVSEYSGDEIAHSSNDLEPPRKRRRVESENPTPPPSGASISPPDKNFRILDEFHRWCDMGIGFDINCQPSRRLVEISQRSTFVPKGYRLLSLNAMPMVDDDSLKEYVTDLLKIRFDRISLGLHSEEEVIYHPLQFCPIWQIRVGHDAPSILNRVLEYIAREVLPDVPLGFFHDDAAQGYYWVITPCEDLVDSIISQLNLLNELYDPDQFRYVHSSVPTRQLSEDDAESIFRCMMDLRNGVPTLISTIPTSPDLLCPHEDDNRDFVLPGSSSVHVDHLKWKQRNILSVDSRVIIVHGSQLGVPGRGEVGRITYTASSVFVIRTSSGRIVRDVRITNVRPYFRPGDWVYIAEGPWSGVEGWVHGLESDTGFVYIHCVKAPEDILQEYVLASSDPGPKEAPLNSGGCTLPCCYTDRKVSIDSILKVHALFVSEMVDTFSSRISERRCMFSHGVLRFPSNKHDIRVGRFVKIIRRNPTSLYPNHTYGKEWGKHDKGRTGTVQSLTENRAFVIFSSDGSVGRFFLPCVVDKDTGVSMEDFNYYFFKSESSQRLFRRRDRIPKPVQYDEDHTVPPEFSEVFSSDVRRPALRLVPQPDTGKTPRHNTDFPYGGEGNWDPGSRTPGRPAESSLPSHSADLPSSWGGSVPWVLETSWNPREDTQLSTAGTGDLTPHAPSSVAQTPSAPTYVVDHPPSPSLFIQTLEKHNLFNGVHQLIIRLNMHKHPWHPDDYDYQRLHKAVGVVRSWNPVRKVAEVDIQPTIWSGNKLIRENKLKFRSNDFGVRVFPHWCLENARLLLSANGGVAVINLDGQTAYLITYNWGKLKNAETNDASPEEPEPKPSKAKSSNAESSTAESSNAESSKAKSSKYGRDKDPHYNIVSDFPNQKGHYFSRSAITWKRKHMYEYDDLWFPYEFHWQN